MTLDAPVRESCVMRRTTTNTPLQALVLWNDVQFVEAARALAARVLHGSSDGESQRVLRLFRIVTSRVPDPSEVEVVRAALAECRARFAAEPDDAAALLAVGEAPLAADLDPVEHAAWTIVANSILNLHETLTQD
jgi:hypothetical protein